MNIGKTSLRAAAVIVFLSVLTDLLFSQTVKVTEVLDANLFRLHNGQVVRLAGIYVPGVADTNKNLIPLGREIKDFGEKYFLRRNFRIKYNSLLADSTIMVNLYRAYPSGEDEDVAEIFLKKGYAACVGNADTAAGLKYAAYEAEAKSAGAGIWSLIPPDYFTGSGSQVYRKANSIKSGSDVPMGKGSAGKPQYGRNNFTSLSFYKDPTLAGVLSFIAPGTGEFYNEEYLHGVLYMGATAFCYYEYFASARIENGKLKAPIGYLIAGTLVHIISIVDASCGASRHNERIDLSLSKDRDTYSLALRVGLGW